MNLIGGDSDARAVLCALIGLMEDSDPVVRTRFSQSVRFLLTETTRNSEQGSLSEVRITSEMTQIYKLHSFCNTVEIHILINNSTVHLQLYFKVSYILLSGHDLIILGLFLVKILFLMCVCFFSLFKLLVARLKEAFNNAKLNRDDELRNTLILTTGEIGRYGAPFVNTQEQNSLKF